MTNARDKTIKLLGKNMENFVLGKGFFICSFFLSLFISGCTTQLPGSYSWIPVLIKHKTHTCVCVCAVSAYNIGSNYVATFSQNHKIFHQDCWLKFELSMTQICWKKIFKR